jgi:hypothetical protein
MRSNSASSKNGNRTEVKAKMHEQPASNKRASSSVQSTESEGPQSPVGGATTGRSARQNAASGQGQQHPDAVAGQHATGSFTDENLAKTEKSARKK